jgi:hypothetical protein
MQHILHVASNRRRTVATPRIFGCVVSVLKHVPLDSGLVVDLSPANLQSKCPENALITGSWVEIGSTISRSIFQAIPRHNRELGQRRPQKRHSLLEGIFSIERARATICCEKNQP